MFCYNCNYPQAIAIRHKKKLVLFWKNGCHLKQVTKRHNDIVVLLLNSASLR